MLLIGVLGAFAGFLFGCRYFVLIGLFGGLAGGALGIFAGAFGWEYFDHFGEKCRQAFETRRYFVGTFWLLSSLGVLLLTYVGPLWLLALVARR